jgi:hypothetical protein
MNSYVFSHKLKKYHANYKTTYLFQKLLFKKKTAQLLIFDFSIEKNTLFFA